MTIFRTPYVDKDGRLQFEGWGWVIVAGFPWVVGIFTIVSWL